MVDTIVKMESLSIAPMSAIMAALSASFVLFNAYRYPDVINAKLLHHLNASLMFSEEELNRSSIHVELGTLLWYQRYLKAGLSFPRHKKDRHNDRRLRLWLFSVH